VYFYCFSENKITNTVQNGLPNRQIYDIDGNHFVYSIK
jgi:hypothetical protein